MKQIFLIIIVLLYSCNAPTRTDKGTSQMDIEKPTANDNSTEWLTVSNNISSTIFEDSCLTAELKIVTVDLTDSIIGLIDKCNDKSLAVLAAKYQYPDGSINIRSRIYQDTILTVSIGEYMGTYEEDYYELLIDSITTKWTFENRTFNQLSRDSIRTIKTIKL